MSNAAKLKKRAVELEQKKQFDKALALYIQFLQESEGALDDVDVPLYNRVGDLMLRVGNASDALNYYEKAVDLYAERGFLNNAIALCNKVLRQSPGRTSIYYKLGRISANKGFKSDAKKNFLEYADRMQKAGQIDEAFRALKEFADLCPDQDDIRLMLAEQLSKENRQDEALEQLQKLHDKLDSEGRTAEARATVDRMKAIDPEAVPRTSGSYQQLKTSDLIFLDTSFEQAARPRQPAPPTARQVSDPDLVALTLGDRHDAPVSPVHNAAVAEAFSLDLATPETAESPRPELALLDVGDIEVSDLDVGNLGAGELDVAAVDLSADGIDQLDAAASEPMAPAADSDGVPAVPAVDLDMDGIAAAIDDAALDLPSDVEIGMLELEPAGAEALLAAQEEPATVDLATDQSSYVSGPPLGIDYAGDLAMDVALPSDAPMSDLFDFRSPPRTDDNTFGAGPVASLDPDVAFPSLGLEDTSLPSADEVTSGASLAAALGEMSLGTDAGDFDLTVDAGALDAVDDVATADALSAATEAEESREMETTGAADDAPAPDAGTLDLEWPAASDVEVPRSALADGDREVDDIDVADIDVAAMDVDDDTPPGSASDGDAAERLAARTEAVETDDATANAARNDDPDDAPSNSAAPPPVTITPAAATPVSTTPAATPVVPATPAESGRAIRGDNAPSPREDWQTRRERAERFLEAGDRAAGLQELEQVSAQLEREGALERALTIVDELIRLSPDVVRHHQKRVELAFRASDRPKLIDAYIELGDALFRSGEERKARAVYQRVLELAPDDPRARAAMDSVASMSPPMGSGAIPAIAPPQAVPARPAGVSPAPRAPLREAPQAHHAGNGLAASPPSRKPSPLDRSAATNGDFVDLGEWLRSGDSPKSTRMVAEEKPPTGDEEADFQEMLKRFKQGVADNVDEEDYESHYDLGVAYKEMGLMDEAVAEFQKSLRGTAHRVRSYEALGQCFVEKEQYQVASSVLSRAIALGDGDDHHLVGVLYLLGRATEALNKPVEALDYYQRVFAVDIEFRDVADRISEIERKAT